MEGHVRNLPSPEGEALGAELARLTAAGMQGRDFPEPCRSCAFRAGTVPNRCLATVGDALKCVMEQVPFYCHEQVEGEPTVLCRGYAAAMSTLPVDAAPVELPWDFSSEG
jgi:hypothetical protein